MEMKTGNIKNKINSKYYNGINKITQGVPVK